MNRIFAGLSGLALTASAVSMAHAFSSLHIETVSASATVGAGVAQAPLTINALPLDTQVFFGKYLVIGVDIARTDKAPISTQNLTVSLVYQLVDASGQPLSSTFNQLVTLQSDPLNPSHLRGTAQVPRSDLTPVQNGGSILYYFQALQGTSATVLSRAGPGVFPAPSGTATIPTGDYFTASIINSQDGTVSPQGSVISLPDTFEHDGHTALTIPPNAVSATTALTIKQNDLSTLPLGPGGSSAVVAYTVQMDNNAQPQRPVQLTLSYPADLTGAVIGSSAGAGALAAYWFDISNSRWELLSLPQLNTSLHTITSVTTRFATFALFPVGRVGASALATQEKIITPNGDGRNDTADFSAVDGAVHIFDIHGRRVRTISGTAPSWDGRDDNGHIVESGVYLYQFTSDGKRVSGVIAVAK